MTINYTPLDLESMPPEDSRWQPSKGPVRIVLRNTAAETTGRLLVKYRLWHESSDAYGPTKSTTLAQWLRWVRMCEAQQMEGDE